MKKDSTLFYFVNKFQPDKSTQKEEKGGIGNALTSFGYEPSERSIKNILDFAASYETLESVETGYVELNLN